MRNAFKKILAKNEYYDDILGMIVTDNKFRLWILRIFLLLIPLMTVLILFTDVF
jgi:hypothetical protein